MVVSDEEEFKDTTSELPPEETTLPLTLEYVEKTDEKLELNSPEITCHETIETLEETQAFEDEKNLPEECSKTFETTLEDIKGEKNIPKTIEITLNSKNETGLEIQFTSLKLKKFPIKENNLSSYEKEIETIGLNNTKVQIGDIILNNVSIKVLGYKKFKMVELKTREFKVAFSVALFDGNTLRKNEDYFKYEIFSKLKNSRLLNVVQIFKSIFSGTSISFTINDLKGDIIFENRIQLYKFNLIEETIREYENIVANFHGIKVKNLSECDLDFYTIHLLAQLLKENTLLNTWINCRFENNYNIEVGDNLIFTKLHNLSLKGLNFNLKEIVKLKDKISEKEINKQKNEISCYRKMVEIHLEKIMK